MAAAAILNLLPVWILVTWPISGCSYIYIPTKFSNCISTGGWVIAYKLLYHRLCCSGSTVITMTSEVNGKMEILTPCRSETPENIETKIGQNDYIVGPFNPANFRRNRSKVVRSPNSWNITLNFVIPFLPFPSLPFFLVVAYSKNGWTDFHDLYLKDVPFGDFDEKKCLGYQNPINPLKVGVVRRFQAKRKKNWIFNIFETISQINTKFDRTLKTAKAPSWVVL